ncbi:MAG: cupredoxin domain-containing protein [Chloroflexi bacterium]|nr:cupredoxin domain-containing protein [Chloroflexota bacterium]
MTPIPNAPDSKTVVTIVAARVRWVPNTLTAPAGEVWHVQIDNQDGPPEIHNFIVASGNTFPERIYQSPNFKKGIFTFDVPALPAGNYLFICTVHPEVMTGSLELR